MKIKTQDFLSILSSIKPGIDQKGLIENTDNFIFTEQYIASFNDNICIIYPFKGEFKCSVPAEELYQTIKCFDNNLLDIFIDNNLLNIIDNNTVVKLKIDYADDIINIIDSFQITNKKMKNLPKDFLEALSLCRLSVLKDKQRPAMNCIFIEDEYMASTDGMRISEYHLSQSMDCSILLPVFSVNYLLNYPIKYFYLTSRWVFFKTDNLFFCSRLIDSEFPNYEKIFRDFKSSRKINFPENIKSKLQPAIIFAEGDNKYDKSIHLEIKNNKLICKSQNDYGSLLIKEDYKNEENINISFDINPYFLLEILKYTQTFKYNDTKILFKSNSFNHIIALLK